MTIGSRNCNYRLKWHKEIMSKMKTTLKDGDKTINLCVEVNKNCSIVDIYDDETGLRIKVNPDPLKPSELFTHFYGRQYTVDTPEDIQEMYEYTKEMYKRWS